MKKSMCIFVLLLFCISVTACAVPDEKSSEPTQIVGDSAELVHIKSKWQRYVIDRTDTVTQVQLTLGLADSHMGLITTKEDINAVLDVCETLDISQLRLLTEDELPEISIYGDLHIYISGADPKDGISIRLTKNGELYISDTTNASRCMAYAEGWLVYDLLYKIKYADYLK